MAIWVMKPLSLRRGSSITSHPYSILNQLFGPIQRLPQSLKSGRIIAFAFLLDGGVSEAAYRGAQTFDRFVANP